MGVHSIICSPIDVHSKKPAETRDRIVKLMGDIPRVELFARQKVEGWDAMGFDVDGKSIQESINSRICELPTHAKGDGMVLRSFI